MAALQGQVQIKLRGKGVTGGKNPFPTSDYFCWGSEMIIGDIACRDSSQGLHLWFLTVPDWSAVIVIANMSVCSAAAVIVDIGWEECWSCDCWQCLECCICDCWQCLDWGIQLGLLTVPGWGCWNCEIILLHVSWFDSCQCVAGSMPFCPPPLPSEI